MKQITTNTPYFPYFDDYDYNKDFYKILFKPLSEIQARELNQLQTILKEQLARFGNHVFQNGSLVLGGDHQINSLCFALKVQSEYAFTEEFLSNLEGKYISSLDGTSRAQILNIEIEEDHIFTFIINDITSTILDENEVCVFTLNESDDVFSNINFLILERTMACLIKFNSGIIYLDGEFILISDQKLILSKSSNIFSGSIGFEIQKRFVENLGGTDTFLVDLKLTTRPLSLFQGNTNFAEQEILGNFIEFLRVDQGNLLKDVRVPIYSELEKTLARRTFDESGNYTVKPFSCKAVNNISDNNKFSLEVSPGKAYVLGYEFESITTRSIPLDRGLDYHQKNNFEISTYYGNFIRLEDFQGFFDVQKCEKIDLLNDYIENLTFTPGGNYGDSIIGSARVRFVRFLDTEINLYLFDVRTQENLTFADVKSVCVSDILSFNRGMGNLIESVLLEKEKSSLLFEFPEKALKTLRTEAGLPNGDYTIQKTYSGIIFAPMDTPNAPEDIVYGVLENFPLERFILNPTYYLIVSREDNSYFYPDYIESIDTENTRIMIGCNKTTFEGDVYALVNVNFAKEKQKKEETGVLSLSLPSLTSNQILSLEELDVFRLDSILLDNSTEIVDKFILLPNRNKDSYNISTIQYIGNSIGIPCNLTVEFTYFKRIGNGFFSVDSYVNRNQIPEENFITGNVYPVHCVDFRVDIRNDEVVEAYIPIPDATFECSYSYYLPRIDKLVVTSSKNLEIMRGISSKDPSPPRDRLDAMTLYTLTIPAYSDNPEDIIVKFHENKRYTMRDIGKLEDRIANLEYYVSLSLLEKDTKDMQILDENGNNRFKNGFLIDNFKTFKSVDYASVDSKCSLDTTEGILRPSFTMSNQPLLYNPYESETRRCGDLIIMPFTEVPFIEQLKASETMNLQPFEVFIWEGEIKLFPETDEWIDTETKPDVIANQFGTTDVFAEIGTKAFSVVWNSWEKNILGASETTDLDSVKHVNPNEIATAAVKKLWNPTVDSNIDPYIITIYNDWVKNGFTTGFDKTVPDGYVNGKPAIYMDFKSQIDEYSKTAVQNGFGPSNIITNSMGESVTDIAMAPFIRARDIKVMARNLKPNTKFYVLFDEDDVSLLCNNGNHIISNEVGELTFIFKLPGGKYRNGEHVVKLKDNLEMYGVSSFAETKYTANGLKQTKQETIISTREPTLISQPIAKKVISEQKVAWIPPAIKPSPTPTPSRSFTPTKVMFIYSPAWNATDSTNFNFLLKNDFGLNLTVPFRRGKYNSVTLEGAFLDFPEWRKRTDIIVVPPEQVDIPFSCNTAVDNLPGGWSFCYHLMAHSAFRQESWPDSKVYSILDDTSKEGVDYSNTIFHWQNMNKLDSTGNDELPSSNPFVFKPAKLIPGALNIFWIYSHVRQGEKLYHDPLAESFFVDENDYAEGVFLTSADLFFRTKSQTESVTVEIRPTVNGYPSSTEIIPFAQTSLSASEIIVSEDASVYTRFYFPSPVYLKTGEYHLIVRTKDTAYTAWIARLGHFELGSQEVRITKNPYIGVLLKSANASTWIPDSDADLKFRLNRCSFDISKPVKCQLENSPYFSEEPVLTPRPYNIIRQNIVNIIPDKTRLDTFNSTFIKESNLSEKTKAVNFNESIELLDQFILKDMNGSTTQTITKLLPHLEERDETARYNTDYHKDSLVNSLTYYSPSYISTCNFNSNKETVSPVIDLQRLSATLVKNNINYLTTEEALASEEERDGGVAEARYITKNVVLASTTPANKLFVSFAANIPRDSTCQGRIQVYYKIFNSLYDAAETTIKLKSWQYLATADTKSASDLEYLDYEFQTDLISYEGNNSITDFDQFMIKLVFESQNPSFVPKVKDFRVIALTL